MTIKGLFLPILGQPNPNEPTDIHLVGRYALGVTWADGHSSIRSEEHTSELQSHSEISYAVFCLKKKKK